MGPSIIGTASGKAILLGEHAVVYGVPAIVVGIDRGATARAASSRRGRERAGLGAQPAGHPGREHRRGARLPGPLEHLRGDPSGARRSDHRSPRGRGPGMLGGARRRHRAGSRCLAAKRPAAPTDAAARAMVWESVFHGNPSGIDAAAASRGDACSTSEAMRG